MIYEKLKKIINSVPEKIENIHTINGLAFSKDPLDYLAFVKAIKFYNEKKYDLSLSEFKKIELYLKDNSYFNFKIGMCYFKKGNWANAVHYFEKSKNLKGFKESWNIQYHAAKKHFKTNKLNLSLLKEYYYADKGNKDFLFEYASGLVKNKSYWLAIYEIESYFEKYEKFEELIFVLGDAYEKMGDHDKAIKLFEELTNIDGENTNYLYRYGCNLEKARNEDLAELVYDQFIYLKQDEELKKCGVGFVHIEHGDWLLAINSLSRHLKKIDSSNKIYSLRGDAYTRLYRWEEALQDYLQYLNYISYQDAEIHKKIALCYLRLNDHKNAFEHYGKVIDKLNKFSKEICQKYIHLANILGIQLEDFYYKLVDMDENYFDLNSEKIFSNISEKRASSYIKYYENLEINENTILFESFFGNSLSCNPYAICLEVLKDTRFKDFKFVIVLNDFNNLPSNIKDDRVILVKRQSDLYLRYLATSKYLINNVSFDAYFIRKEGQIYLNTWHGTPLKTLGKDIAYPLLDYANVSRNFLHCTHIITQNRFTTNIILDKYNIRDLYQGKIAETGYPRVDLTLNISEEQKNHVKFLLGLDLEKPIVVYAPTWRGNSEVKDFDIDRLVNDYERLISDEYQLIFKCHHLVENLLKTKIPDFNLVPHNIDTNELLAVADILISDYSSISFDFLSLKKPIISYAYDYDNYCNERGMYVSLDQLLGEVVTDIDSLIDAVNTNLGKKADYQEQIEKFVAIEDGNSAKRVVDLIINNDESHVYNYERKPVTLMFGGPYIPNGITKSFNNLLTNLENELPSLHVIVNKRDVLSRANCKAEFEKTFKDHVNYHARIGSAPMTVQDYWVRNKFEKDFFFSSENFESDYLNIYQREARRIFGDAEFENVINFEGYAIFWVALFSQINAKKKIIFQHNDLYSEWKTRFPYLKGVFNLYNKYDKIVSVSELTMINNIVNLSDRFALPESKFDYSNNTILPEEIKTLALDEAEILNEFKNFKGKRLINIGRLSHEKDQEKLIRAFYKSKSHEYCGLFILGDGPLRDHLQDLIKHFGLQDKVFLLGQVSNPYAYLKNSDIFVLSSNHEGQPMVLLEALTLGVPIIATDIVGNRSILNGYDECLVENNVDALSVKIIHSLCSPVSVFFDATKYNLDAKSMLLKNIVDRV